MGDPVAVDQGVADEQLAGPGRGRRGRSWTVRPATIGSPYSVTVSVATARAAPRVPPRLAVRAPHEVGADALGPLRLDGRDAAGPQPVRSRPARPPSPTAASFLASTDPRAIANVAPRAPRYCARVAGRAARCATAARPAATGGCGRGGRGSVAGAHAERRRDLAQLAEQVLPLPHAQVVEELVRHSRRNWFDDSSRCRSRRWSHSATSASRSDCRRHVEAAVRSSAACRLSVRAARAGPGSTAPRR